MNEPETMVYNYALFACARWETAHIAEWLTYHGTIGFEHVYLCCNDDDSDDLYQAIMPFTVGPNPFVTFVHFPFPGAQRQMYLHLIRHYLTQCRYGMFLDIDEFVTLPKEQSIDVFRRRVLNDAAAVYLNWMMFGNSGHVTRPQGCVLLNYTQRETWFHPYTKVLFRADRIDIDVFTETRRPFWHQWPGVDDRIVNVIQDDMGHYYDDFPDRATAYVRKPDVEAGLLSNGYISHFALKSEDDFERRLLRGTAGDFSLQTIWANEKALGRHHAILDSHNAVETNWLADYWRSVLKRGRGSAVVPPAGQPNIALGKPATQSSMSEWSIGQSLAEDAGGAVNGQLGEGHQFHTGLDEPAWWQVDLLSPSAITEIRIFNRLDSAAFRARHIAIDLSSDGEHWVRVATKADDTRVGGVDGAPFRWLAGTETNARFVRVSSLDRQYLHLNQVQVFGTPLESH